MIPVLEALMTLFVADPAIAAAVSDGAGNYRIYGPRRTMPEFAPPLPASIVLQRAGGRNVPPKVYPRTFIRCYAAAVQEAEALYRLLWPLFYNERGLARGMRTVGGRWLLYQGQLSEPDTAIEPEGGWPVAAGTLVSEWYAQELQGA